MPPHGRISKKLLYPKWYKSDIGKRLQGDKSNKIPEGNRDIWDIDYSGKRWNQYDKSSGL